MLRSASFHKMSNFRAASTLLIPMLIALCGRPLVSHAGLVLSNLDQESSMGWGVNGSTYGPESWLANRFTVGAGVWSITSMELPLHTYNPGTISNLFTFEIRNDVGSPGSTVLGSFDTATPLVTSMYSSRFTFAPSAPISLAGGNYWLVMRPTDPDSSDFWQLASSGIEDFAAPGWSIADNFSFSQNGDSNWLMNTPDNAPLSHSNLPLTFSFDATQTAVPEPSSFALVADLVGGAWWKRRRVKSQAAIAAVA